ncbi:MAG: T9SS type A sorting domain-containing protein [Bacteroidota bacterium]
MKFQFLLLVLLSTPSLLAQSFSEISQTPFPGVNVGSVSFADIDGDNDQDVLITGSGDSELITQLFINDGLGNYTEVQNTALEVVGASASAFADVDDDDDLDLLITGSNGTDRIANLYLNDGGGNFSVVMNTPFEVLSAGTVNFEDVDGDDDLDVLTTGSNVNGWRTKLYLNDGSGNFTEAMGTPFEPVAASSVAFADVNGDDEPDVLITGFNGSIRVAKLYLNDGSGNFTEMMNTPFDGVEGSSVNFADVDDDDDLDVLITGFNTSSQGTAILYLNDGSGNFTVAMNTPFEGVGVSAATFSDVDGDDDPDVLITGFTGFIPIAELYVNDASGNFTQVQPAIFDPVQFSALAFADIDGDSDEDVLITGRDLNFVSIAKLYRNEEIVSSINDMTVGVEISVYPNPARSNVLNLQFDAAETGQATIQIYHQNGQLIHTQHESVAGGQNLLSIQVTELVAGSYFLQLQQGNQKGVVPFVVQ